MSRNDVATVIDAKAFARRLITVMRAGAHISIGIKCSHCPIIASQLQVRRLRPVLANKYLNVEERRLPTDPTRRSPAAATASQCARRKVHTIYSEISIFRPSIRRTACARQCAFSRVTRLIYFRLMIARDNYDPVG